MTKLPLTWRKSSRSDSGGGSNCVEVGAWRTSTRSSGGGSGSNCVEVGTCPTHVAVRDTKHRSGGLLSIDTPEWSSLISSVKAGSFDGESPRV